MSEHAADLLLKFNKAWAERMSNQNPKFFHDLAKDQYPNYLWIGCSDSRVPVTLIVEQSPGDIFVHRNIANLVLHSDINCQSVLQYAVQVLHVEHIIICGHYGCGGIKAALSDKKLGLIDNWLRNIKELYKIHSEEINALESETKRINRLSELNVHQQVHHVCENPFVQEHWANHHELWVHGWMYDLETGLLKDLKVTVGQEKNVLV
jgi:carbonic anhydrase